MNKVDRWLLPDGIEEVLPGLARQTEHLRRQLIDLFESWGYDYVIPPLVEFTDSLLTGSGQDVELQTFKITDQLSGRMLGIRPDITPQAARMDAHSLKREGVNRLCYGGHVLHTKPKSPLSSRSPIKLGVEMFGADGLQAEVEVLSLLLETLQTAQVETQYLDLGHVGIYRALLEAAKLSDEQEASLFALLQSKAFSEIESWCENNIKSDTVAAWIKALPRLSGTSKVIARARERLVDAPAKVHSAIDDLEVVATKIVARYPEANLYFDLSELRGYHYHTGIVFGAFVPGVGNAIAVGGRYDHIGEAFGRSRSATGFDIDLSALCRLLPPTEMKGAGIFVTAENEENLWPQIKELRASAERVVVGVPKQKAPYDYQQCNRELGLHEGEASLQALSVDQ